MRTISFGRWSTGTGEAERLSESSNTQVPTGVTPDGTQVVVQEVTPTRGRDLRLLTLRPAGPSTPRPAQGHPEQSRGATSSGPGEPVGLRRVTPLLETRFDEQNGVLSPDGRWLAYESDNSGRFEIYGRYVVATGNPGRNYDMSPDGRRFLMIKEGGADLVAAPPQLVVVQHFDEELKRLVPTN